MNMSYTVAIVGRPNVGKSTFFNRLLGERKAIVDDFSGVTRDRHYGVSDWNGKEFNIIDTGGFVANSQDVFEAAIRNQVKIAIEEADAIVFVVDVLTGITDLDDAVAEMLRKTEKPVYVAVNKVDNAKRELDASEFYSLGFEQQFSISSISGSGTGELLDEITANIPDDDQHEEEQDIPKIAIIGQPNVGKSSLLNALLGEERNVVTDIAGTTRDTIHTRFTKFGHDLLLIDTAGIRKKNKVHEDIEFYSVIRAVKAIDEADIVVLMIDAQKGIEMQDLKILNIAQKKRRGVVIVVNKWDTIEKTTNTAKQFETEIKERIAPHNDVPVVFASVHEKQRVLKILDEVLQVYENKNRRIPTSKLNDVMLKAIERYHPPTYRGNYINIKYVTQLPTRAPQFAFFANHPKQVKQPYRQYLENQIREHFNFTGATVDVFMREK